MWSQPWLVRARDGNRENAMHAHDPTRRFIREAFLIKVICHVITGTLDTILHSSLSLSPFSFSLLSSPQDVPSYRSERVTEKEKLGTGQ
jgi:hypothetical protein